MRTIVGAVGDGDTGVRAGDETGKVVGTGAETGTGVGAGIKVGVGVQVSEIGGVAFPEFVVTVVLVVVTVWPGVRVAKGPAVRTQAVPFQLNPTMQAHTLAAALTPIEFGTCEQFLKHSGAFQKKPGEQIQPVVPFGATALGMPVQL